MSKTNDQNRKKRAQGRSEREQQSTKRYKLPATQNDLVKLAIRVLAAVVLLAVLIAGLYANAGRWHAALWISALVVALLLADVDLYWFHELRHSNELNPILLLWTASMATFLMVGSIYSALWEEPSSVQEAQAPVEKPPQETFTRVEPEAKPGLTIAFGVSASNVGTPFVFNGQVPFHIYEEGGRMFCDAKVYSAENGQIIEIKHNVLQQLPPGWDSNSNNIGLEVVDAQQNPVFQMYYETPTTLRIQGAIFVPPDTLVLVKGNDQQIANLDMAHTAEQQAMVSQAINEFHLARLFKYPSVMFPGVPN